MLLQLLKTLLASIYRILAINTFKCSQNTTEGGVLFKLYCVTLTFAVISYASAMQSAILPQTLPTSKLSQMCRGKLLEKYNTKLYDNGLVLYDNEHDDSWTQEFNENLNSYTTLMNEINTSLTDRSIHLILTPIPNRSSLLSENIIKTTDVSVNKMNSAYSNLILQLNKNSVDNVNVLKLFQDRIDKTKSWAFLHEAHWTEDAASTVAARISKKLTAGTLNLASSPVLETRYSGLRPIANFVLSDCNVRLADDFYTDYKFYDPSSRFYTRNFSGIEYDKHVWSLGATSDLFLTSAGGQGTISMSFVNPFKNQGIEILINNVPVYYKKEMSIGQHVINLDAKFLLGLNNIRFRLKEWNWKNTVFQSDNLRNGALYFDKLITTNPNINFLENLETDIKPEASGLFSNIEQLSIITGTSYSEESAFNNLKFANFIRLYAKQDFENYARGAGGLSAGMRDLIESGKALGNDKRSIIWEFPIISLVGEGISGLKQIVAALNFKLCAKENISITKLLLNNGEFILSPSEIVRIEAKDLATREINVTGLTKYNLNNNDRQITKNIYYIKNLEQKIIKIALGSSTGSNFDIQICKK